MPVRPRRRAWFIIALATLIALQTAPPVHAWGRLGHRVISRIAEKHLTPEAKAAIAELLEPGESLADASTWADENRGRLPKTAPWHYIDIPLDELRYDAKFSGDVASKGCVVDKINEFRKIIGDKTKSVEQRRVAMRFLIHCVQDMHQPCHVGDNHDAGGKNMHRVWDSGIIERAGTTEDFWLKDLAASDTAENRLEWMKGTVEDWATESLLAAREAYQDPATGNRIKSGTKLGDAYQQKSLPVVRRRLCQAGVRLARVLNEAFSEK
jgi:hypothetical protein